MSAPESPQSRGRRAAAKQAPTYNGVVLLGLWYCYLNARRELEGNGDGEDDDQEEPTIFVALARIRERVNELVNKPGIDLKLRGNWWEMRCIPALQRSHSPDMELININGDSITITERGHQMFAHAAAHQESDFANRTKQERQRTRAMENNDIVQTQARRYKHADRASRIHQAFRNMVPDQTSSAIVPSSAYRDPGMGTAPHAIVAEETQAVSRPPSYSPDLLPRYSQHNESISSRPALLEAPRTSASTLTPCSSFSSLPSLSSISVTSDASHEQRLLPAAGASAALKSAAWDWQILFMAALFAFMVLLLAGDELTTLPWWERIGYNPLMLAAIFVFCGRTYVL